jgi:tetratricopeptide (TPR) repeat protein
MGLESLMAGLVYADATAVQRAVAAVSSLDGAQACLDEGSLLRQPVPPAEGREGARDIRDALATAASLDLAGRWTEAVALIRQARTHADALGWPPLWAAVRAQEGQLLRHLGRYDEAETVVAEAYFEAARVGAWREAAGAATDAISIVGQSQARMAEGRRWAQHARVAIEHAGDRRGLLEARRLYALGAVLRLAGAYPEARDVHERALAIRERELGVDHLDVGASLEQLAIVHEIMGAYGEALRLYERTLEIRSEGLGPDHPEVANTLSNLADVHRQLGDHAAAQALNQQALEITERALGPGHPKLAYHLSNLGALAQARGAHAEALALFERALAIREQSLGLVHPEVASTLNNMAVTYEAMGAYAKAQPLFERALAIWEQVLGPDHPDVASALANLANVYKSTGRIVDARAMYERSLAIKEKALGPEHPRVAVSLVQLGHLLIDHGAAREALPLVERAVAIVNAQPGTQTAELEAHLALAKALAATGGDLTRALAEARKARDGFREAGAGRARELADAEEWLAAHARGP